MTLMFGPILVLIGASVAVGLFSGVAYLIPRARRAWHGAAMRAIRWTVFLGAILTGLLVFHVAPVWVNAWVHPTSHYGELPLPPHALDRGSFGAGTERLYYTQLGPDDVIRFYERLPAVTTAARSAAHDAVVLDLQYKASAYTLVVRVGVWHGANILFNPLPGAGPDYLIVPGVHDRDEWIPISSMYMR